MINENTFRVGFSKKQTWWGSVKTLFGRSLLYAPSSFLWVMYEPFLLFVAGAVGMVISIFLWFVMMICCLLAGFSGYLIPITHREGDKSE